MTIPNILTLLRLVLVPIFIVVSFQGRFTLAFILFITAAVTDILDGMIARRFNQKSRLGAILDPAADKSLMVSGYLFYTLHDRLRVPLPEWLTFVVFLRDVLIVFFAYLVYTRIRVKRFPPSWAGKLSTVLQASTLGTVIGVNSFVPSLVWLAELLFRLALVATLLSAWIYLRQGERLLNEGLDFASQPK